MSVPAADLSPALEAESLRERGVEACLGGAPISLELGIGRADLILALAAEHPERRYLGVEISRKRVEKAARRAVRQELANVRVVHASAELVVERCLPPGCVDECWINCPDPWPKKRHWKRRLVQPPFLRSLARVLAPGARLHLATDHAGYAEWMDEALALVAELENLAAPAAWTDRRPERPVTAYEAEWLAEGRTMAYLEYRRRA